MHKRLSLVVLLGQEFREFFSFFFSYVKRKLVVFSVRFEKNKNLLVKLFMMKRGRYNRPFLHLSTMGVLFIGMSIAPFLADTYPIFTNKAAASDFSSSTSATQSVLAGEDVFHTDISAKPRDKVIVYRVEKGDTIGTIGEKFGISQDTIRWENDLTENSTLDVGEELKILPVTGIAHKVESGDTVYSIAKKYSSNPQAIVDWQFNDFANPETFSLVVGQMLIVPEGVKPSEQPTFKREVYIAQGPVPVSAGGFTFPMRGQIMQFFSWFHPGVDIATSYGAPIYAAHNGTVTQVRLGTYDGGYGNNVWISNGNGIESHYAHLASANVSAGQSVIGGQTIIGYEGSTGRSTGPHLHFEIRVNGANVNPLGYVQ